MYKAFLPAMIAGNHGHLVSIASSAGLVGVNGLAGIHPSPMCLTVNTGNSPIPTTIRKHSHLLVCVCVCLTDYCASKFAAVGFAESVGLELLASGSTGVKTTIVCPFFINTGMFDGANTK